MAVCALDCAGTLQELPAELGRLPALAQLDARNNLIADLPPALGDAAALNELRVGFNNLSSLPSTLGSLRSLRTLDCRNNLITVSDAVTWQAYVMGSSCVCAACSCICCCLRLFCCCLMPLLVVCHHPAQHVPVVLCKLHMQKHERVSRS